LNNPWTVGGWWLVVSGRWSTIRVWPARLTTNYLPTTNHQHQPLGELCQFGLQHADLDEQPGEIEDAALADDLAVLQLVEEDGGHDETLACRGQTEKLADVRPLDPERFVDEEARQEFLGRLKQDGQVQAYLMRLRRMDGSAMWVEITARSDRLQSGRGYRIEAVMRDVTERKRLQDQTRDVYQQLLQAEKLASLGQTMSGVAHELNNPLATILACAERLAARDLDERTRRDLDAIHNAAERAARIVRNLQTFARKRHTTRTTVDLNQVVKETVALRAHEQRVANVRIVDGLAAGLPPVFADPHQIQQILLNLIINAEQAMLAAHGRGTLTLRTWQDPDRDAVLLEVSDDGPGVPEDLQAKVFDPFFTT